MNKSLKNRQKIRRRASGAAVVFATGEVLQKKMGRPASGEAMAHTGVVLPHDLLQRLKADGLSSGRGLSGEIRRRLQASYDQDAGILTPAT